MSTAGQMVGQVSLQGKGTSQAAPLLTLSAASLSFGVTVNAAAATQSFDVSLDLNLSNSATITGAGFTIVGSNLPVTPNPTQSTALQVEYDPIIRGGSGR